MQRIILKNIMKHIVRTIKYLFALTFLGVMAIITFGIGYWFWIMVS